MRGRLELSDWVSFASTEADFALSTLAEPLDRLVGELWKGLARRDFTPIYGSPTASDISLASSATSGGTLSEELLPRYEDED
jgi:hypothetical protein